MNSLFACPFAPRMFVGFVSAPIMQDMTLVNAPETTTYGVMDIPVHIVANFRNFVGQSALRCAVSSAYLWRMPESVASSYMTLLMMVTMMLMMMIMMGERTER